jgi:hypothetical protein
MSLCPVLIALSLVLAISSAGGCSGGDSNALLSNGSGGPADSGGRSDAFSGSGSSSGGVAPVAGGDAGSEARAATGVDSSSGAVDSGTNSSAIADATSESASASAAEGGLDAATAAVQPFGCQFAWGEPSPSGSLASYGWLQFVTTWVGSEVQSDGSIGSCSACSWLTGQVAGTNLIPAYYAYFIGFYGHANGLPDQNQQPNGPNLATGGGALILGTANSGCPSGQICSSNKIVQMYGWYAAQSHAAWPTKPLVWLIEGDFIQYTAEATTQTQPLSYAQLGQLAVEIAKAIKTNMPNAVVSFDDSAWVNDMDRKSYWTAISSANYDMVWTTGVGNNTPFLNAGETSSTYNGGTATYSFLRTFTGKKILVDESAGMSQQNDTWSNQSAATINTLISEGVVAVNVSGAPSNYPSNVAALEPQLGSTCP